MKVDVICMFFPFEGKLYLVWDPQSEKMPPVRIHHCKKQTRSPTGTNKAYMVFLVPHYAWGLVIKVSKRHEYIADSFREQSLYHRLRFRSLILDELWNLRRKNIPRFRETSHHCENYHSCNYIIIVSYKLASQAQIVVCRKYVYFRRTCSWVSGESFIWRDCWTVTWKPKVS